MTDDDLVAELRRVATIADAPPPGSGPSAKAAFGLGRLEDELARLVQDTAADPVGAHRGSDPRLIAFASSEVRLDVEVSTASLGHRLTGLVDGPVTRVAVETPEASYAVTLDDHGRFRVSGVAGPLMRLAMATQSGRGVATPWVRLA